MDHRFIAPFDSHSVLVPTLRLDSSISDPRVLNGFGYLLIRLAQSNLEDLFASVLTRFFS